MGLNEPPTIQSLLIADEVKLVNGLLHVRNGGWRILNRVFPKSYVPLPDSPPPQTPLGIAVTVAVRWQHRADKEYRLIVRMYDEDGKSMSTIGAHVIHQGPPSDMPPGGVQYPIYIMQLGFPFPCAGEYMIVASIEGIADSERRWVFQVRDVTN